MNILQRAFRKVYHSSLGKIPAVDRFFRYRHPHEYWKRRGGDAYFAEQEGVEDRTARSHFIAEEVSGLSFSSFLEIGCGYGKQLQNIQRRTSGMFFAGCDFSRPQLRKGFEFFPSMRGRVVEADAEFLPFADKSFDAVMSSAVILHNEYRKAQRIIWEMIRVGRKFLIHNEDTDLTFSRYGYDMTRTYRAMGFKIIVSKEIPCSQVPSDTQFTIAEIPVGPPAVMPGDVPLCYHKD